MRILRSLLVVTIALVALPAGAQAARSGGHAVGFKLDRVASGLGQPTYVTSPPGDARLFVVEQTGLIRIIQDGKLLPTPFADLSKLVTAAGEQGLLGLAFHPDFAQNGRLFVYYTSRSQHEQVWELHAKPGADTISGRRRLLIDMVDPFPNHNGGDLQFGPDGYLYIGTGDGGSAGDPGARSQNVKVPLGKLLRIDVDRHPSGRPYGIPADNPFANHREGLAFIYAWGSATRGATRSTRRRATSGSATWARTAGRRSTTSHAARRSPRTSAGATTRAPTCSTGRAR